MHIINNIRNITDYVWYLENIFLKEKKIVLTNFYHVVNNSKPDGDTITAVRLLLKALIFFFF